MASCLILQERIRSAFAPGDVSYFHPKWMCPPHFHGQLEVCVITQGEIEVLVGAKYYRVAAPALIWHPPTIGHGVTRVSSDLRFWTVTFEPALLTSRQWLGSSCQPKANQPFSSWIGRFLHTVGDSPVFQISRRDAWRLDELCERGWLAQFRVGFEQALIELIDSTWSVTQRELFAARNCPLADLGLGIILGAPDQDRNRICRELLVSSSYSARMFRRCWDATFVELRNRARAVTFLALSRRPGASLITCALESGFGSYSQAHRVFRATTGRSPSDYIAGGRVEQALCDYRTALTPWALDVVEAARARRSPHQGADAALAAARMVSG